MSTWVWEFDPDREFVVEGLPKSVVDRVEDAAARLTTAAEVAYPSLPKPPPGVSGLHSFVDGDLILYFQEDYRDPDDRDEGVIVIVRVVYAGVAD